MKNLLFGLIATVLFTFSGNAQSIDIKNPDNYGAIHNEIVASFKKAGKSVSEYSTKEEFINDVYNLSLSKYPEVQNSEMIKNLTTSFFSDFKKPDFDNNFNKNLTNLYLSKKISSVLYDNFKIIITEKSYEKSLEIIGNLEKTDLVENDKQALRIFKSVLIASNQYWSSSSSTVGKFKYCREVADGIGALLWWWSGPGSIVAGVVYSIAVEEGGGCN